MKTKENIKWICVNAMGIALFVVLSMCLRFPVFQNYYLCLGYIGGCLPFNLNELKLAKPPKKRSV